MEQNESKGRAEGEAEEVEWTEELKNGGSLSYTDVSDSSAGWTSIPGDFFTVRGPQYLTDRVKIPGGESLLQPLALDWLRSSARVDNVLKLPHNRVVSALAQAAKAGAEDPFVWAFNLQVPSKEHYSAIAYFISYNKFEEGSVGDRFLKGDDALKNTRLKLIANISEGPWIVKKAVGEQAICILGRSLTCRYLQGANFIEVDVDIGSSIVANAIVHLAIGYLTTLTVDLAFLLEAQAESELPEQILGTVRLKKMDLAAAVPVEQDAATSEETSFQSRFWRGISTFMQPSLQGNSDDEPA